MKQISISIIIPVYNCEKYISRCIESILNQKYKNIELIIIDDGSTDNTGIICDAYSKSNKNILVIHQKNQGVSYARNNGIKVAKGDYIGFVDADDFIDSTMYEKMINEIKKENYDIIICNYFYENEKNQKNQTFDYKNYIIKRENYPKDMFYNRFVGGYIWNKLYKKSIIKNNNIIFNNKINILEDDLFNYEIFAKNKDLNIKFINDKLYHYIQLKTGASKSMFNLKKMTSLDSRILEIEILDKENINSDYLKADYICTYIRAKKLAIKNNIYIKEVFNKYENYYKEYKTKIKISNLEGCIKYKYIIIKYLRFIYYIKLLNEK